MNQTKFQYLEIITTIVYIPERLNLIAFAFNYFWPKTKCSNYIIWNWIYKIIQDSICENIYRMAFSAPIWN